MLDLYNIIINDPVYITIAVILAIAVVFSVVKKLFKFAAILIAICVLYIGYLYYTGEEIPKTADDLIENVSEKAEDAVEGFVRDGRVGHTHLSVPGHDGRYGFGGSCFPKDIQALINCANDLGVDMNVLNGVWKTNLEVRPEKDWEQLKGRSIVDE